jgi:hypothetical protein
VLRHARGSLAFSVPAMNSPRQLLPGFFSCRIEMGQSSVSSNFLSGSPLRKAANKSNAQSRLFFQKRSPEMEVTGLPRLLEDAGAACSKTAPITQRLGPQLFPKKKAPTREISRGQLDHGWMRPTRVVKKFIADSLGSSAPHTAPRRSCSGTHACRRHWGG